LNGHPGVVHGGLTSTLFDNTFGWLFFALGKPPAVTANLTVNFKRPVYANSTVLLKAKLQEAEGRKLYMVATMENSDGMILADSTALFIILRRRYLFLRDVQSFWNSIWTSR
jgi:acyl-coenzyme A thioesterase PaaI-like protein